MNHPNTSNTLLHRAQHGDSDAWSQIEELYWPLVHFWCQQRAVPVAEIAEVKANVLGTVSIQLVRFKHNGRTGAFRNWLRTIAVTEIANHYRTKGGAVACAGGTTANELLLQAPEPTAEETSLETTILYKQAWELISAECSERDKAIFTRVVENDERPKQVAEEMGLKPHVVHKVVSRIKRLLRDRLGEEVESVGV